MRLSRSCFFLLYRRTHAQRRGGAALSVPSPHPLTPSTHSVYTPSREGRGEQPSLFSFLTAHLSLLQTPFLPPLPPLTSLSHKIVISKNSPIPYTCRNHTVPGCLQQTNTLIHLNKDRNATGSNLRIRTRIEKAMRLGFDTFRRNVNWQMAIKQKCHMAALHVLHKHLDDDSTTP